MGQIELRLSAEHSEELKATIESLKKSAEVFPHLRDLLGELILDGADRLAPGLVEIRNLPTSRAGGLAFALDVSERLREIAAAAATGELDRLLLCRTSGDCT